MSFCPTCKKEFLYATVCPECGFNFSRGQATTSAENKPYSVHYESYLKTPVLSGILYFFGFLALVGGLICSKTFWPDSSTLEVGYSYKTIAYIPSIAWLISGIVSAFIFIALGRIIDDLGFLRHNVKYLIEKELSKAKE